MITEKAKIEGVDELDDSYSILLDNSTGFMLNKKYEYVPQIGDEIELFGNGARIRGISANSKMVFYKSDEQLEQERKEWLENNEKEKEKRFEEQKEEMDKDYESLPVEFQRRIDRFRKNNPRFRVDYESYELFCCKEAVKIAGALKTPKAIVKFKKLKYDKQKKMVAISDDHSGNTFGCAVMLAYWYVKEKENVVKMHGALSPLVGNEAYGDIEKGANSVDQTHTEEE